MEGERSNQETKWIDAWIRWDRTDDDSCQDDEEEIGENPFQLDSSQDFSFSFHPGGDTDKRIQIYLRGYKSDSEEAWSSTGLTPWPSGEYLCRYLARHQHLFAAKEKVLECGSGLGLCGILARMILKSPNVVLTDGDTETLSQLRRNVKLNCEEDTTISCHQLLWGLESAKSFQSTHGTFDLILGSDLVYVRAVVQPLWDTVDTLLANNGVFIMAYCARRTESERNVTLEDILEASGIAGFSNECAETASNDEGEAIYIHRFFRETVESK